mmetsp:Transcript_76530/g.248257  ORF Transcript_76530/g.248257 Transcript_76530/m.248257 type:complete len:200 (+) Transcript_76530:242-841(+)
MWVFFACFAAMEICSTSCCAWRSVAAMLSSAVFSLSRVSFRAASSVCRARAVSFMICSRVVPVRTFSMDLMLSRRRAWFPKISLTMASSMPFLRWCSAVSMLMAVSCRTLPSRPWTSSMSSFGLLDACLAKSSHERSCSSDMAVLRARASRHEANCKLSCTTPSCVSTSSRRTPCSCRGRTRLAMNLAMLSKVIGSHSE